LIIVVSLWDRGSPLASRPASPYGRTGPPAIDSIREPREVGKGRKALSIRGVPGDYPVSAPHSMRAEEGL